MKKFNLILILIFSYQLGISQTNQQKVSKSDSLFFQDYSFSGRMKNNSYVNTSINVKTLDYTKILKKLSEKIIYKSNLLFNLNFNEYFFLIHPIQNRPKKKQCYAPTYQGCIRCSK